MSQIDPNTLRADVVGSLLRPNNLLQAQKAIIKEEITVHQFKQIEDKAVKNAVSIQEKAGLKVVTDGEMRRPVFCHNFVQAVTGFEWDIPGNTVIWFDMNGNKIVDPVTVGVTQEMEKEHDISVEEFAFLRAITDKTIKVTIPSPTMMSYYFVPGISDAVYSSPLDFLQQATQILQQGVAHLEQLGLRYLQIDAPEFGMLLDPVQQKWFADKGFDPDKLIKQGVAMINQVLSPFSGLKALHVCRGNDKNRFMAKGGYDKIASTVFNQAQVDRLLLEFDSDRSGDFRPLKHVSKEKSVVLGLVSTKTPKLEKQSELIRRIEEASQIIPLENLAISTQCGFASVAKGNNLSFKDQNQKLSLVVDTAEKMWGKDRG